jgi:hypothetical protein
MADHRDRMSSSKLCCSPGTSSASLAAAMYGNHRNRRLAELRTEHSRGVSREGRLRRKDPQGREASRSPHRATEQIGDGAKPEDGEGARHNGTAVNSRARRYRNRKTIYLLATATRARSHPAGECSYLKCSGRKARSPANANGGRCEAPRLPRKTPALNGTYPGFETPSPKPWKIYVNGIGEVAILSTII